MSPGSRQAGEPKTRMVTQTLEKLGVSVDTPPGWKKRELLDGKIYVLSSGGRRPAQYFRVNVRRMEDTPGSLEEAAKPCVRKSTARVLEKKTLPSGAYYVSCGLSIAGRTIKQSITVLPLGDAAVECVGSHRTNPALPRQVCQSLRKR